MASMLNRVKLLKPNIVLRHISDSHDRTNNPLVDRLLNLDVHHINHEREGVVAHQREQSDDKEVNQSVHCCVSFLLDDNSDDVDEVDCPNHRRSGDCNENSVLFERCLAEHFTYLLYGLLETIESDPG